MHFISLENEDFRVRNLGYDVSQAISPTHRCYWKVVLYLDRETIHRHGWEIVGMIRDRWNDIRIHRGEPMIDMPLVPFLPEGGRAMTTEEYEAVQQAEQNEAEIQRLLEERPNFPDDLVDNIMGMTEEQWMDWIVKESERTDPESVERFDRALGIREVLIASDGAVDEPPPYDG